MEELPRILIVDDDHTFRTLLTQELAQTFPDVSSAASASQALEICGSSDLDVVLLDIRMPDRDGLEVLKELKSGCFDGEVIMLTGHASIDTAISSLKMGAYDYLSKPCKLEELESVVQKAFEKRVLRRQNWTLRQVLARQAGLCEIVGESAALKSVLDMVSKVAPTDATVLIQGESGVGKEFVARAIHTQSYRKSQPLVVVDCSSLQEELLQSELFGHESGAFTGAVALKHGLFELADSGTILLDEIAELSLSLQARLLRVLEVGIFHRIGGVRDIRVNVRILVSTNQDLEQLVKDGKFREDLYYRINVVSITVPPLRERMEDIPLLVRHFVGRGKPCDQGTVRISDEALAMLSRYHWPGNVRELKNVLERAQILAEGEPILPRHLPSNLRPESGPPSISAGSSLPSLKDLERLYIRNLLKQFGGHRSKVASALGISERSLYRKLHEYSLDM